MNGIFDSDTLIGGEGDDLLNDGFLDDRDDLDGGPGTTRSTPPTRAATT